MRDFPARLGSLSYYNKSEKVFEENHIKAFDWPGNSSDLNPIENLWSIIKTWFLKKGLNNPNEAH